MLDIDKQIVYVLKLWLLVPPNVCFNQRVPKNQIKTSVSKNTQQVQLRTENTNQSKEGE